MDFKEARKHRVYKQNKDQFNVPLVGFVIFSCFGNQGEGVTVDVSVSVQLVCCCG